jgi:hypothetical protein
VGFGAFITLVINWTAQTERKSEKIGIVSAAEHILRLRNISTEAFQGILSMNALSSQAPEPV